MPRKPRPPKDPKTTVIDRATPEVQTVAQLEDAGRAAEPKVVVTVEAQLKTDQILCPTCGHTLVPVARSNKSRHPEILLWCTNNNKCPTIKQAYRLPTVTLEKVDA